MGETGWSWLRTQIMSSPAVAHEFLVLVIIVSGIRVGGTTAPLLGRASGADRWLKENG